MKTRCTSILFIILLSFCGIGSLYAQEGYKLEDIYFSGNESFSDNELISQTSLYTLSWFEKTILRKDKFIFSEEYLEADIKKMITFYQQHGFIDVDIVYRFLNVDHENRSMEIEIIISENGNVSVKEVNHTLISENRESEQIADYQRAIGESIMYSIAINVICAAVKDLRFIGAHVYDGRDPVASINGFRSVNEP